MALSARQRIQGIGLVYWTVAVIETALVIVTWNTSLISLGIELFALNFGAGFCGLSVFFIAGAYAGDLRANDRLLFNKEPFPRASGTLAAVFLVTFLVCAVSTVKINFATHGLSPETPTSSCANRVSYVVQTRHDKWIAYKCVSHREWLQVDKALPLAMGAGSTLFPMIFGTVLLGLSISKGRSHGPADDIVT